MLDERIAAAGEGQRQTVLLSATMHANLGRLAALSLRNPAAIGFRGALLGGQLIVEGQNVASAGGKSSALAADGGTPTFDIPKQLKQFYVEVCGPLICKVCS